MNKDSQLNIRIDAALKRELEVACCVTQKSQGEFVRSAIERELKTIRKNKSMRDIIKVLVLQNNQRENSQ